jgi:hypothetical protein
VGDLRVVAMFGTQDLDRDHVTGFRIARLDDQSHPACAQNLKHGEALDLSNRAWPAWWLQDAAGEYRVFGVQRSRRKRIRWRDRR